jgi:hypothetical protein
MPFGTADTRIGAGQVMAGSVRMSTNLIPCDCMCTWAVVKPGPGTECVSDLRYRNALCPCRHRPAAVPAVTRVP